jgi:hypothetical protein
MLFNDNYYDQSFLYAKTDDTRSTSPMSYCITLINAKTYELLPLLGDRVFVEFLQLSESGDDVTGIESLTDVRSKMSEVRGDVYDLQGRKLQGKPTAKGLYINHGRKIIVK